MRASEELSKSLSDVMAAALHATAVLTLHLTGRHRLPQGEVDRLCKLLTNFLEAIDALPPT